MGTKTLAIGGVEIVLTPCLVERMRFPTFGSLSEIYMNEFLFAGLVDDVLIPLLCPLIRCLICLIRESSRIQCREAYEQNAFHARLPESLNGRIKKAEAEP
jgi:hypothetical protein